jgi:hypothetical protein
MGSCSSGQMAFSCHQLKEKKKTADDHKYVECLKKKIIITYTQFTHKTAVCAALYDGKKGKMYFYTVHHGAVSSNATHYSIERAKKTSRPLV